MKIAVTVKNEVKHLHNLLKHQDRWYIDVVCFNEAITEYVKGEVNDALISLGVNAMYNRYLRWTKEDKFLGENEDYYQAFLNHVVQGMAIDSLKGEDRYVYGDTMVVTVVFI